MNTAVVIIPVWRRPEMLAICLKRIKEAKDWNLNYYLFTFDEGAETSDNLKVIRDSKLPYYCLYHQQRMCEGNSYNILDGLEFALDTASRSNSDIIHLLEEDIWIAKDYFQFHRQVHDRFDPWVVSACRNQHMYPDPPVKPNLVYSSIDYQSLGISFAIDAVQEIIVHNTPDYYNNMTGYIRTMFPNSRYGSLFPEQDGLIQRIMEKHNYETMYPYAPRAFHAGFYSYHRSGKEPTGTLKEKIDYLEKITEAEMNNNSSYKDIRFLPNYEGYGEVNLEYK